MLQGNKGGLEGLDGIKSTTSNSVGHFVFPVSSRLLNLVRATGHPSFVMLFVFIHEPGAGEACIGPGGKQSYKLPHRIPCFGIEVVFNGQSSSPSRSRVGMGRFLYVGSIGSKLQRVSSEDLRTPFRGLAVNQNSGMRSALEFFATAHSFCERSLESVNCTGLTLPILLPSRARWPPVTHLICWDGTETPFNTQCAVRQL